MLEGAKFCKKGRQGLEETSGGLKELQRSLRAAEAQAAKREEKQTEITASLWASQESRRNEASCILRRAVGKGR